MADNVVITAGSGTNVGTDERTISATAVHVQRVVPEGGTGLATGQVTPTASAATLVAARETRKALIIENDSNVEVFVGPATVTTANGFGIPPGGGLVLNTTVLVQLIVATVTGMVGNIDYAETYDA